MKTVCPHNYHHNGFVVPKECSTSSRQGAQFKWSSCVISNP